jgi:hypothetical protein
VPNHDPRRLLAAIAVAAPLALSAGACRRAELDPRPDPTPTTPTTSHDDGIAEHSKEVMPFDLSRATHAFAPVPDGLIETVETMAPVDPAQVEAIRGHLRNEAEKFTAGDWSDPARIHGEDMPGLAELRDGYRQLTVAYEDAPAGGRLTYATQDPALVDALHRWGAAQTTDHGRHEHGR